jgi:hypothetical protein
LRRVTVGPSLPGPTGPVPPTPIESASPSDMPQISLWHVTQATALSVERIGS